MDLVCEVTVVPASSFLCGELHAEGSFHHSYVLADCALHICNLFEF